MFKKKIELEIMINKENTEDWKKLETLIKDNWEIKEINNYTPYYTHITIYK